jgi:hypothetical protein
MATLTMPNQTETPASSAPASAPAAKTAKSKTVRLRLKHDIWIDDGTGTGGTIRLETNIKRLDEKGNPIFDAKKGDFERIQIEHDVPLELAKILLAEDKAVRTDPLPGEEQA